MLVICGYESKEGISKSYIANCYFHLPTWSLHVHNGILSFACMGDIVLLLALPCFIGLSIMEFYTLVGDLSKTKSII